MQNRCTPFMNTKTNKIQKWLIGLIIVLVILYITPLIGPFLYPPLGTEYSEGFEKNIYNKIKIGDTKNKVDSLLGDPLLITEFVVEKDSVHLINWYSKNTTSFLLYQKIMIEFYNNKVVNKICFLDGD